MGAYSSLPPAKDAGFLEHAASYGSARGESSLFAATPGVRAFGPSAHEQSLQITLRSLEFPVRSAHEHTSRATKPTDCIRGVETCPQCSGQLREAVVAVMGDAPILMIASISALICPAGRQ
jgi:hypothetical protein